jgi:formylglycine-generating enzyme required for sulfatase activity
MCDIIDFVQMTWVLRLLVGLALAGVVRGCSSESSIKLVDLDDASAGGSGGGSGSGLGGAGGSAAGFGGADAGSDVTSDAVTGCPGSLTGPGLVEVPAPNGDTYCVDSTEVTNAQYAAFLAKPPSASQQPTECAWNTSFDPATSPLCSERTDSVVRPNHPVVCVDWCDAVSYCAWAGKRLCGRIGGGASDYLAVADPTISQWFNACSAQGANSYPYGDAYEGQTCNGGDFLADDVIPVRAAAACHGPSAPWSAIYDLSGNAMEWEDACEAASGSDDACRLRGGAFGHAATNLRCDSLGALARNYRGIEVGFRCCLH